VPYLRCPAEMQFRFRCYRNPEFWKGLSATSLITPRRIKF
jgi:hypothetical protein